MISLKDSTCSVGDLAALSQAMGDVSFETARIQISQNLNNGYLFCEENLFFYKLSDDKKRIIVKMPYKSIDNPWVYMLFVLSEDKKYVEIFNERENSDDYFLVLDKKDSFPDEAFMFERKEECFFCNIKEFSSITSHYKIALNVQRGEVVGFTLDI